MRRRMLALVSAGVATIALGGCGASDSSEEDAVRAAVERWSAAGEENDAATYCDLLSADLRSSYDDAGEQLAGAGEDPCEATVGTQAELEVDDTGSEVTIDPVTVDGDEATADVSITLPAVSSEPIVANLGLTKEEGEWKIDDTGVPPPGS